MSSFVDLCGVLNRPTDSILVKNLSITLFGDIFHKKTHGNGCWSWTAEYLYSLSTFLVYCYCYYYYYYYYLHFLFHYTEPIKLPSSQPLTQLKNLKEVALPTLHLSVDPRCCYDDIVYVKHFEPTFKLAGGINLPKILACVGSDGVRRRQLVKVRGQGSYEIHFHKTRSFRS